MIRSNLYVPGDRPDRFDKAVRSGADAIILDLEDSVAEPAKVEARDNVARWLAGHPEASAWVRVNNRPDLLAADLAMAADVSCLGVVMPKAEPAVCDIDGLDVLALVETATGVATLGELVEIPSVQRLALGAADLAADLGMDPSADGREWAPIRSWMVVASAAAGLHPPVGPVHTDLNDHEGLVATTEALRRQGFGGRSAIHPAQIDAINTAFQPTAQQLAWATAVVSAAADSDTGGAMVDGEFIDAAVLRRARQVLAGASGE